MIVSEFFTLREQELLRRYKEDADNLRRSECLELIKAFDRFIDTPPPYVHRSMVGEAKHLVALLNGRVAGMDTSVESDYEY